MAAVWLILRYAPRWNWRREDVVSFEMLSDYIGANSEGEPATSIALRHSFRNLVILQHATGCYVHELSDMSGFLVFFIFR